MVGAGSIEEEGGAVAGRLAGSEDQGGRRWPASAPAVRTKLRSGGGRRSRWIRLIM